MKKIALSAGHYSQAKGAVYNDLVEHDLANIWLDYIFDEYDELHSLDKVVFELVFVPPGTLKEKVKFINDNECDYAVEIHFNSAPGDFKYTGSETLYMPDSIKGKEFAKLVHEATIDILEVPDRGIKKGLYWSTKEQTNTPLYFLRRTRCPAIIVEPEFLQSYADTINSSKIEKYAKALLLSFNTLK